MAGENQGDDPQNPADVSRETSPGADDQKPDESPNEKAQLKDELGREIKGWLGNRDKALVDTLTTKFDSIVEQKLSTYTKPTTEPAEEAEFDWSNPIPAVEQAVKKEVSRMRQAETTESRQFQEDLINGAGGYMDSNPVFEDKEFGKAVLETAMANIGKANRGVDGKIAGQMLVQEATMQVIAAQKEGTNALSGRPASNAPSGSVNPPAAGGLPKKEVTMPKLSDHAQKLVDRYGYSAEDVIKILGDE